MYLVFSTNLILWKLEVKWKNEAMRLLYKILNAEFMHGIEQFESLKPESLYKRVSADYVWNLKHCIKDSKQNTISGAKGKKESKEATI
jgi:hypothetical protein